MFTDDEIINLLKKSKNQVDSNKMRLSWLEKHQDIYNYLQNRFSDTQDIHEIVYRIFHHIESVPICPVCGKPIKFYKNRYHDFCSVSCSVIGTQDERRKTSLQRYGVTHPTMLSETQEK